MKYITNIIKQENKYAMIVVDEKQMNERVLG